MNIQGIQCFGTGYLAPDPHWILKAHSHPFHEIIVPLQGRIHVESPGQNLNATVGDVLLYPAQVVHEESSHAAAPVACFHVAFQAPAIQDRAVVMTPDRSGRIREIIHWLYEERHATDPYIKEERPLLIATILTEFCRNLKHRDHPVVFHIRQYIHDHIAKPLTLDHLAHQAQMSRCHFLRTYKALTGNTPMQDLRMIRAYAARELILRTNLPLKEIAPLTGLGNEYALSRIFRQQFNMPPGAWRRHRNKSEE